MRLLAVAHGMLDGDVVAAADIAGVKFCRLAQRLGHPGIARQIMSRGASAAEALVSVRLDVISPLMEACLSKARIDGMVGGGTALAWICRRSWLHRVVEVPSLRPDGWLVSILRLTCDVCSNRLVHSGASHGSAKIRRLNHNVRRLDVPTTCIGIGQRVCGHDLAWVAHLPTLLP